MITKDPTWNLIVENLRDFHRTEKFMKKVMKKIKELDKQNDESPNN